MEIPLPPTAINAPSWKHGVQPWAGLIDDAGTDFYKMPSRYEAINAGQICGSAADSLGTTSLWGCAALVAAKGKTYFMHGTTRDGKQNECLLKQEQSSECPEADFYSGGGFYRVLPTFRQLKANVLCNAKTTDLGDTPKVEDCAAKAQTQQFEFFSHSFSIATNDGGKCLGSAATTTTCDAGFTTSNYNFYQVLPQPVIVSFGQSCKNTGSVFQGVSLWECAQQVLKSGAHFFSYTHTGYCTVNPTADKSCPEGLQWVDDSDFFAIGV
jgi:hypothetical protein